MAGKFIETIPKGAFNQTMGGSIVGFGYGKDKFSLGGFTNRLTNWGKGTGAIKNTIYHYIVDGKQAGAGRLSAGMAQAGKRWVQGGMVDKKKRAVRYEGPDLQQDHNEAYAEWKKKVGFGDLVSHLTGAMAGAFGVKKSSYGGVELGILGNRYTNSPLVAKLGPGHKDSPPVYGVEYNKKKVRIADYARAQEFGTSVIPARPLITGLIAGYLHQVDPEWAELFKTMMYESYWDIDQDYTGDISLNDEGVQAGGGGLSTTQGETIAKIQSHIYNLADATEISALELDGVDRLLQWTSDDMPQNLPVVHQANMQAKVINVVAKILQEKTDFDMEDIREISHSIIYGKYKGI